MSKVVPLHTLDLHARAKEVQFALLIGTSQPAVNAQKKKGVLSPNGSYGQWIAEYCEQLRKEASGRASDKQNELTEARIEESRENTATKKQARLIASGSLVQLEDISMIVMELPRFMKLDVLAAGESIHESLQIKHGIQIDEDEVLEPLRATLRHVGDRVQKLRRSAGLDTGGSDTETSAAVG